jgi:hypothetical protein
MLDQFSEFMNSGGPVMWVIFVTAWVAIIMLFERAIRIQRWYKSANADQQKIDADTSYTPSPINLQALRR